MDEDVLRPAEMINLQNSKIKSFEDNIVNIFRCAIKGQTEYRKIFAA